MKNIIENLGKDREEIVRIYAEVETAIENLKTQIIKLEAKKPSLIKQVASLNKAIKLLRKGE